MIRISKQEWHNISDSDLIRYVILDERKGVQAQFLKYTTSLLRMDGIKETNIIDLI